MIDHLPSGAAGRHAHLLSLGVSAPDLCWSQRQTAEELTRLWGLQGEALDRWRRIVTGSGIARRHAVLEVEHVINLSTAQRMAAFAQTAPALATSAASKAIVQAQTNPLDITDLIIVSCTGFAAPGVDVELVDRLGLRPSVRRSTIGFMGCFGAITGLRAAAGACALNPGAVVLMVCVELCSLHLRRDADPQNMVASALFADGAAAALLTSSEASKRDSLGVITPGHAMLLPHGRDWMTWTVTDRGFAMTLGREVPAALRQAIGKFVSECTGGQSPGTVIVHPGGAGILDAVQEGLGLEGCSGLEVSREVLNEYGNMSSGTVLFVLHEALSRGFPPPMMLLAFGPGLTIESLMLEPAALPLLASKTARMSRAAGGQVSCSQGRKKRGVRESH